MAMSEDERIDILMGRGPAFLDALDFIVRASAGGIFRTRQGSTIFETVARAI
jgi:hypothetical protein